MRTVIFGSTLIGIMGVSILSPALPDVKEALSLNDFQVGLLITVFTLPGIFFAPIMGILADRYGRGIVLSLSLITFGLSGFACAFVNFETMLILRLIQGIGGSALTSLAVTLIGDIYNGFERVKMLGYNASALSIGLAVYPLIGGILAGFDWRFPFIASLSSIPIGLLALKLKHRSDRKKFRLKLDREILLAYLLGCSVFLFTYGVFYFYIPIMLEDRFNANSIIRGLVQSSTLILTAFVASKLSFFVKRFGTYGTISLGFLGYGISLLTIPLSTSIVIMALFTMIYGFGHGTVLPALQNLLVEKTDIENRATVITIYNSTIRVGQTIGPIIASFIGYSSFLISSILSFTLATLVFLSKIIYYDRFPDRT